MLTSQFQTLFHSPPTLLSQAPGRVNLIGEHTDYNNGFVFPIAIDRHTSLLAAPRTDPLIRLHSLGMHETVQFSLVQEIPKEGPAWSLYAKGTVEALRRRVPLTRGFDALIHTTIPLGAGLSSSAALEISVALMTLAINHQSLPLDQIALAAQWAENNYPDMPCGIMDQFISALATPGHALLLDCRDRSTRQIPLDDPNLRIVISNSNVKHALVTGEYAARRRQCQAAVAHFQLTHPHISSLRDATMPILLAAQPTMPPIPFRRARHIITENQRTLDFAAALEKRDYPSCGTLMFASHASLRDDYQVSCPELDALVQIAASVPNVFGARMTGGGFGGSIVALAHTSAVQPLTDAINSLYPQKCPGQKATTFSTTASAGGTVQTLDPKKSEFFP